MSALWSPAETARRVYGMIARATIKKVNDRPKVQEIDVEMLHEEEKTNVEYFGQYGFKSVPLKPAGKEKAEAVVVFPAGNRSHGIVVAIDDRRHRPRDWKEGEVGLYDDLKQTVRLTRDGIRISGGDGKKPMEFTVGNAKGRIEDGKITLTVDSMKVIITPSRIDLGGEGGSKVATEAGYSSKVFAVL